MRYALVAFLAAVACDRPGATTFNTTVIINTGTLERPFNNGTMSLPPQPPAAACPLPAEKP